MIEIRCKQKYIEALVEHLMGTTADDSHEVYRKQTKIAYCTKPVTTDKTDKNWLKQHTNH